MHDDCSRDDAPVRSRRNPAFTESAGEDEERERQSEKDRRNQARHVCTKRNRQRDVHECIEPNKCCKDEHCIRTTRRRLISRGQECEEESERREDKQADAKLGDLDSAVERAKQRRAARLHHGEHARRRDGFLAVMQGEDEADQEIRGSSRHGERIMTITVAR